MNNNFNYSIKYKNDMKYINLKLEKQINNLFIIYLTAKNKSDSIKALNSILNFIFKLKLEKNYNFSIYFSYLIIIIFHKRQFKNNKINPHSKDIFYETILNIYDYEPNIIKTLIYSDIISTYGYIQDYINIWKLIIKKMKDEYKINSGYEFKNKFFNNFYNKYNPLIISIVSILNFKKEQDLKRFDLFLKEKYEIIKDYNLSNNNLIIIFNGLNMV